MWDTAAAEKAHCFILYRGWQNMRTALWSATDIRSKDRDRSAAIARGLVNNPKILLLDEPIANLDIYHQMKVMKLLRQLSAEGITVIITIHDINMAARFCNKALMLKQGMVFASGDQSVYVSANIEYLYDIEVEVVRYKDNICIMPKNL